MVSASQSPPDSTTRERQPLLCMRAVDSAPRPPSGTHPPHLNENLRNLKIAERTGVLALVRGVGVQRMVEHPGLGVLDDAIDLVAPLEVLIEDARLEGDVGEQDERRGGRGGRAGKDVGGADRDRPPQARAGDAARAEAARAEPDAACAEAGHEQRHRREER